MLVVLFLLVDYGLSWLPRVPVIRRYLTARLEAKFGRTVEVSNFEISILGRPEVVANYITVGEDPRFGHEFFLRAEQLTASLRWRSLLRGRVELGTLSLTRPSLNLVRLPTGQWNLENWLPATPGRPEPHSAEGRLYRIEIDAGRINFKRGVEKHPFALVDVSGTLDQETPGRWRIDIEASLMRAGVVVQEAGLLRVRGRVGGTAARLRPADLRIAWEDASLADVLRLWRGQDYGVRGQVALEAVAQSGLTETAQPSTGYAPWSFRATVRMRGVHRWDLPPRPGDPAVNLRLEAVWKPEQARLEIARAELEAPGSTARLTGLLDWTRPRNGEPGAESPFLRVRSASIALNDVLAWYRAFRPGVNDSAALDGSAGSDLLFSGWPLRFTSGVLAGNNAELRQPGIAGSVRLGPFSIVTQRGSLVLLPATLTLTGEQPRREPPFRLEGKLYPQAGGAFEMSLTGQTARVQQFLRFTSALGWSPFSGWTLEGAANLRMRWQGRAVPFALETQGQVEVRNLRVAARFLSQPVQLTNGRLEFTPGGFRFELRSAEALGARWNGTVERKERSAPWEFVLAADRLEVSEVARWLRAGARGTLLERITPLGAASAPAAFPIHARGRLEIGQLWLRPLELRRVRGHAELSRDTVWRLRLGDAQADFFGGTVSGSLVASGEGEPSYRFEGQFDLVNLAALSATTPALTGRFAGTASGELRLAARGRSRDDLIQSVEGKGDVEVRAGELRGLDLLAWLRSDPPAARPDSRARATPFQSAIADFQVASRTITVEGLKLTATSLEAEVSGTVDFQQALELHVRELPRTLASGAPAAAGGDGRTVRVTGTLATPQVTVLEQGASPAPTPRKQLRPR